MTALNNGTSLRPSRLESISSKVAMSGQISPRIRNLFDCLRSPFPQNSYTTRGGNCKKLINICSSYIRYTGKNKTMPNVSMRATCQKYFFPHEMHFERQTMSVVNLRFSYH